MNLQNLDIKKYIESGDWALFLDRDGVINRRIIDDYVKKPEEFEFLPGVLDAIAAFSKHFKRIFVVTNQQGIGKGLMSEEDLALIHANMLAEIENTGGQIDEIYYCPDLRGTGSKHRKPEIGMALQAQKDFPEVDFSRSIMVGDSISDMQFGKTAGMLTVFVDPEQKVKSEFIDYSAIALSEIAQKLE